MLVFDFLTDFRTWRESLPSERTVALVPTMGALHEGHAQLIRDASTTADETVVTIFVNKIQFTNQSDYDKYPRTTESDLRIAEESGATVVLIPRDDDMTPLLSGNTISAGSIGQLWEGVNRPGHFDGVLTVVNQLFRLTNPYRARFGEKDRQQLIIITEWARTAWPAITIDRGSTVRDADGLALSSRNRRLSSSARVAALTLSRALHAMKDAVTAGVTGSREIEAGGRAVVSASCDVHYLAIVDGQTLQPQETVDQHSVALIAATVDGVRLIDNVDLCS